MSVAIPALAELLIGGYRISGPSLWRDEAATITAVTRPSSAILTLIRHEDAVHALYYLLLHPWVDAAGTSELALRLPSLLAMCAAAALTGALGRRLAIAAAVPAPAVTGALGRRLAIAAAVPAPAVTGLLAGLVLAAVPTTTRYAQEARPYAFATLCAVAATYLLVRAAAGSRPSWWAGYAAALALTGLFNLFALPLLALAHGASLLLARSSAPVKCRRWGKNNSDGTSLVLADVPDRGRVPVTGSLGRWLVACAVAGAVASPVALLSAGQAAQISWVTAPGPSAVASLLRDFAGSAPLIPVVAVLALIGCLVGQGLKRGAGLSLANLAVPWLVLPPVLLIAVSLVHPVYVERYVVFCLPALSLLLAAGLTGLVQIARSRTWLGGILPGHARLAALLPSAAAGVIMVSALAGPQLAIRRATARADDLRAVAAALAARGRPGDAIVYLPWGTRMVGLAYQAPFQRLADVELGISPVASGTLTGTQAPPGTIRARLGGARRVWAVRWTQPPRGFALSPADREAIACVAGLRPIRTWIVGSVTLTLYAAPRLSPPRAATPPTAHSWDQGTSRAPLPGLRAGASRTQVAGAVAGILTTRGA